MKRVIAAVLLAFILCGCSSNYEMHHALTLRDSMESAERCTFDAVISADYGNTVYSFQMQCTCDSTDGMTFTVLDPVSISGISGKISGTEAFLTFDDHVLSFPPLADGQVTPVTAPWLLYNTLRSGYIASCGTDGENIRLTIDDSYDENPIQLDIWLDKSNTPIHSDILYSGKRILSLDVKNFTLS